MITDTFIAPSCHQSIAILHEDAHLLVINKPSGLLSLSGKNPLNLDSVHYRLVQDYPSATMVHRLDFGTSGIMVLALNKETNANLTKQFQERTIIKTYLATLYGHFDQDEGVIDAPVAKGNFPYQKICSETGKSAQSYYQVLERNQNSVTQHKTSEILFTPKTGRTHQLRIHSQTLGHPIIGCDLYNSIINGVDTQTLASRLCLHAYNLEFTHPITLKLMAFECPRPLDPTF